MMRRFIILILGFFTCCFVSIRNVKAISFSYGIGIPNITSTNSNFTVVDANDLSIGAPIETTFNVTNGNDTFMPAVDTVALYNFNVHPLGNTITSLEIVTDGSLTTDQLKELSNNTVYIQDFEGHTKKIGSISSSPLNIPVSGQYLDKGVIYVQFDSNNPINFSGWAIKAKGSITSVQNNYALVWHSGYSKGMVNQDIVVSLQTWPKGQLTVKYQDEQGNQIAKDDVLSNFVGMKYSTKPKDFSEYTLDYIKGNSSGEYTNQPQTVVYVYSKNPVKGGNVTTKFVDEHGSKIASDQVLQGNVGDNYTATAATVNGYTLLTTSAYANGTFTNQEQTVTFVYSKDATKPKEPSTPVEISQPVKSIAPNYSDKLTNGSQSLKQIKTKKSSRYLLPNTSTQKTSTIWIGITITGLLMGSVFIFKGKNKNN